MKYFKIIKNDYTLKFFDILKQEVDNKDSIDIGHILKKLKDDDITQDKLNNYLDYSCLLLAELLSNLKDNVVDKDNILANVKNITLLDDIKKEIIDMLVALKESDVEKSNSDLISEFKEKDLLNELNIEIDSLISKIKSFDNKYIKGNKDIMQENSSDVEFKDVKEKEEKWYLKNKFAKGFLYFCSFLVTWLSLYILIYGLVTTYESVSLKTSGIEAQAEVVNIASQLYSKQKDGDKEKFVYQHFEVIKFKTEEGHEVVSRLNAKPQSDIPYVKGDTITILYNKDAPSQVIEKDSNSQLIRGIIAIVFATFVLFAINFMSHDLFYKNNRYLKSLSYGSKGVLLILALAILFYQNIYSLYQYLPSTDSKDLIKENDILISKDSNTPFSGRAHNKDADYLFVYSYKDGKFDGLNVVYYNGAIKEVGHWKDGKQDGLFILYTTSGVLLDAAYFKDGLREGHTEQYYDESGILKSEGSYKKGKLDGIWKEFYAESGNVLSERTYVDGKLNGSVKHFFPDGSIWLDMNFVDDVPDGPYKLYYRGGQIQVDAVLKQGKYGTDFKMYDKKGNLLDINKLDEEVKVQKPN